LLALISGLRHTGWRKKHGKPIESESTPQYKKEIYMNTDLLKNGFRVTPFED
jgi:hypothetical protein